MKKCSTCKIDKHLSDYAVKDSAKNRLSSECKPCHRIVRKKYYQNNSSAEKERVRKNKLSLRHWLKAKKDGLCCNRCGQSHPATIQFHHSDPKQKEFSVSQAVHNGWSKERILREMEKCEVLCANCHFIHHWKERKS